MFNDFPCFSTLMPPFTSEVPSLWICEHQVPARSRSAEQEHLQDLRCRCSLATQKRSPVETGLESVPRGLGGLGGLGMNPYGYLERWLSPDMIRHAWAQSQPTNVKSLSHILWGELPHALVYSIHTCVHFHVGMLIMNNGFLQNRGVPQSSGDFDTFS